MRIETQVSHPPDFLSINESIGKLYRFQQCDVIPNPVRWWHVLLWKSPGFTVTFTLEELNDKSKVENAQREIKGASRGSSACCCGETGRCTLLEVPEDI